MNGAMIDRLPVDDFTTLSIAALSRLSSLEQTDLLITMGLAPLRFRDWKLDRRISCGDREPSVLALTGGFANRGLGCVRRFVVELAGLSGASGRDRESHDCNEWSLGGSIDSFEPTAGWRAAQVARTGGIGLWASPRPSPLSPHL